MYSSDTEVFIESNGLKVRTLGDILEQSIDKGNPDFKILTDKGFKKFSFKKGNESQFKPIQIVSNYTPVVLDSNQILRTPKQTLKASELSTLDQFELNHEPIKSKKDAKNGFLKQVSPFILFGVTNMIPIDDGFKVSSILGSKSINELTEAVKKLYDFCGLDKVDYISYEEDNEFNIEIKNPVVVQTIFDILIDSTPIIDASFDERKGLLLDCITSIAGNKSARVMTCMDLCFDTFKKLVTSIGWNFEVLDVTKFSLPSGYEGYMYIIHIIDNIVSSKELGMITKIEKFEQDPESPVYPVEIEGLTTERLVLSNGFII